MNKPKSPSGMLKSAMEGSVKKAKEASRNGNPELKIHWELRAKYYEERLVQYKFREDGLEIPRRAFVSYSKQSATMHYNLLKKSLRDDGFNVKDGFQSHQQSEGKVLKTVINQLQTCTVFIGILTKEIQFNATGNMLWSPSVWAVEEVGMAIALGIPYTLMIQEGIHDNFWRKVSPDREHVHFNNENFECKCKDMVEMADRLYNAHAMRMGYPLNIANIRK